MAVIIAKKVAFDLSKAFKMLVTASGKHLCIYYPFSDGKKGECWTECLPLNDDTDGENLLAYLVQAKESDVILIWDDLLKNFRKKPGRREEVQLREEVERLRSEVKRLREENKRLQLQIEALEDAHAAEVAAADREIDVDHDDD